MKICRKKEKKKVFGTVRRLKFQRHIFEINIYLVSFKKCRKLSYFLFKNIKANQIMNLNKIAFN